MDRIHLHNRQYAKQLIDYKKRHLEFIIGGLSFIIVLIITGFELDLLQTELMIKHMVSQKIDYEDFRELNLSEEILDGTKRQANELVSEYPELRKMPFIDEAGCLTFNMMAFSYNMSDSRLIDNEIIRKNICRLAQTPQFQELYGYYKAIFHDLEFFPVPKVADKSADVSYVDSWYLPRTYGGDRKHEGTDLMASNNLRGFFPVISMTDGTIEKMGWLEQGGYRIGIRSASGGYFYYAHLYSYAPELKEGDSVIAGQLLGFMGDSGYGNEGTIGQFDVHLHLGIYVNTDDGEMSVNPYMVLKDLEKYRTIYSNESNEVD